MCDLCGRLTYSRKRFCTSCNTLRFGRLRSINKRDYLALFAVDRQWRRIHVKRLFLSSVQLALPAATICSLCNSRSRCSFEHSQCILPRELFINGGSNTRTGKDLEE